MDLTAATVEVALHSRKLTRADGQQSIAELAYPGYDRVSVPRDSSGWALAGSVAAPVAVIEFPAPTADGYDLATHFSIGVGGTVLYSGAIEPPISIVAGVPPKLHAGTQITES